MKTVHAIYENGVFRPLEDIDLPDRTEVEFVPHLVVRGNDDHALDRTYAILSFDTDSSDLARRHDEHQP